MKLEQIAIQLYTLRDFIKTPADIAATMKRVAKIGYRAVQVSAMGPIPEEELNAILQGEGLTCCATHEGGTTILNETQKVIDRLGKLNCRYTAYPYPKDIDFTQAEQVEALAAGLDKAGQVMARAGLVLAYHNHAHEFYRYKGATVLDYLFNATNPKHLQAELDTYWVQAGGGDSTAWCGKLTGRLPLLHLKDYAVDQHGKPVIAEIGNGNLDWPGILEAAACAGTEWYIVEQDTCAGDPFESITTSFRYLTENFVS